MHRRRSVQKPDRRNLPDRRNKWLANDPLMTDPRTNVDPTFVQLHPCGWEPGMPECILGIGGWLDPTTPEFFEKYNVKMVIKASGVHPNLVQQKPPSYGGSLSGRKKKKILFVDLPANNTTVLEKKWEEVTHSAMKIWARGTLDKPAVVFTHCNEGINRAAFVAIMLSAKIHDHSYWDQAEVLAMVRPINPIWRHGKPNGRHDRNALFRMPAGDVLETRLPD